MDKFSCLPSRSKYLCHVNNNECSQDFNGNIISCLFVLSLALGVFSFPAAVQCGQNREMKKKKGRIWLKDGLSEDQRRAVRKEKRNIDKIEERGGHGEEGGEDIGYNSKELEFQKRFPHIKSSSSSLALLTLYFILSEPFHPYLSTNAFIMASHLSFSNTYMTHTHTHSHSHTHTRHTHTHTTRSNDPFLGLCETKDLSARR